MEINGSLSETVTQLLEHERAGGSVKESDTGTITDGSKASVSDDDVLLVWW